MVSLFAGVGAHQVGRHVVRRAERRTQVEGACSAASSATSSKRTNGRPQHDRVAELVDTATARPARQLRVLARGQTLVMLAGELGELLDHDGAGRHVDPDRQRFGGEHHLHQTRR